MMVAVRLALRIGLCAGVAAACSSLALQTPASPKVDFKTLLGRTSRAYSEALGAPVSKQGACLEYKVPGVGRLFLDQAASDGELPVNVPNSHRLFIVFENSRQASAEKALAALGLELGDKKPKEYSSGIWEIVDYAKGWKGVPSEMTQGKSAFWIPSSRPFQKGKAVTFPQVSAPLEGDEINATPYDILVLTTMAPSHSSSR